MSELKFTCPSCGQHMQCEKSFGGDKTVCPSCASELRIPFSHTPPELKTQLPRAELIMKPDAPAMLTTVATSPIHVVNDNPFAHSDIPVQIETPREPVKTKAPVQPVREQPVKEEPATHCVCPVCRSELRVTAASASNGPPPTAELVNKAPMPAEQPPIENKPEPQPAAHDPTVVERERQIAQARETHQVQLYPAMKPRLSYVLSGEKPPPASDAPSHPASGETHPPGQDVKTLNE